MPKDPKEKQVQIQKIFMAVPGAWHQQIVWRLAPQRTSSRHIVNECHGLQVLKLTLLNVQRSCILLIIILIYNFAEK